MTIFTTRTRIKDKPSFISILSTARTLIIYKCWNKIFQTLPSKFFVELSLIITFPVTIFLISITF